MNSLTKIFTAILCLAFLLFIPVTLQAQTESIDKILNPDGTIKPGHNGSYNVKGYTLADGINGQPVLAKSDSLNKSGKATPKGHFSKGIDGTMYSIHAIAVSGTDVYIGGDFTVIDDTFPVNNIVKWNGSKWSVLGSGTSNGVNGYVYSIVVNGADLYVGGFFSELGDGSSARDVAKYNTITNIWSNLPCGNSNGVAGEVYSLAFLGTDLYIGGGFQQLGDGTSANRIAKWNTITNTWSNLPCGSSNGVKDNYVYSLAVLGPNLYIVGGFSQLGDGTSANRIAKWSTITNTWSNLPCGSSNGVNDNVYSLAVLGTDLYIGGGFTRLGDGTSANRIAKWNTITNTWSTLPCGNSNGIDITGWVMALAVIGTDLYIGGNFSKLGNGTSAKSIVIYNTITNTWVSIVSNTNAYWNSVGVLAASETGVYVGSSLHLNPDVETIAIAKWSISDEKYYFLPVVGFNGVNGSVNSLAVIGEDIYVGGWFYNLRNGESVNHIAKYNTITKTWSTLPSGNLCGVNHQVYTLAVIGDDLYVGGSFSSVGNGLSANSIAKYNTTTKTWSTLSSGNSNGIIGVVETFAVIGDDLYVGGSFNSLENGLSANNIAKYNTTTKTWSTLPCGNSNGVKGYSVKALAVIGANLYIGGWFTQLGDGTSANNIVKWNTETNTWSTLPCGNSNGVKNYGVESFGVLGTDLYVGGAFYQLSDDTWVNCIVKWNTATNAWSTLPSGVSRGVNDVVCSIVVVGEDIYIGGAFYQLGDGTSANRIARWNTITTTWSTLPCGTSNGLNGLVNALAIQGTDLYIGGYFIRLGDETSAHGIAKYNTLDNTWSTLRDLTYVKDPSSDNNESLTTYALQQNYPNPFNPSTTISYDIASPAMVTMVLYDALGREVRTLVNEEKNAGKYTLNLNASTLASGVYFYQLRAGKFVQTKKLMLLK